MARAIVAIAVLVATVAPVGADDTAPEQTLLTDVVYGPRARNRLDLLYPPAGVPVRGTMVWAHGGGWVGGTRDLSDDRANPRWLADQGWVIASVTYDLSSALPGDVHSSFPSAVGDLQRAVRWVRRHQGTHGLGTRVLLGGESAGAHLALLASVMHPRWTGLKGKDIVVDGVVGFAPPSDLLRMYLDHHHFWGTAIGAFAGCAVATTLPGPSPCQGSEAFVFRLAVTGVAPWLQRARRARLDIPPIYLLGGSADTLLPPRHHVRPLARAWRTATGTRASARFNICACDHNIDPSGFDQLRLRTWLDAR